MFEFIRRHVWVLPIAFAVLLAVVGWTTYRALEQSMKRELTSRLETVRNSTVTALELWSEEIRAVASDHADRTEIREAAKEMLKLARRSEDAREALLASPTLSSLRTMMAPVLERHGFEGWGVFAPDGIMLVGSTDTNEGLRIVPIQSYVDEWNRGLTTVSTPTLIRLTSVQQSQSLMVVGGPILGESGEPIGAFGLSLDPEKVYGRLLVVGRPGETGETLAFDKDGLLVSPSRFDPQLREIGLLPGDPEVSSFMRIHMRFPGGNLVEGYEATAPPKARPLTFAAASAIGGESGVDVEGFPDYRGVPVVAAWAWLPELGIGVTSEIEVAEAYAGLYVLQQRFGLLVGALAIGALGMFLYSFIVMRLRREVDQARQIGRYHIERKLGAGGMGTVYLASHALLRRPTAMKILNAKQAGKEGIARFEREVQLSSSLTHPNTIQIFDYGNTDDDTFYYVMEYVNGFTLGSCVANDGPLPEARVVFLMKQVCASLAEAHKRGLMHRDLKPANVMICERGGAFDFVKVLDFGLAKEMTQTQDVGLTDVSSLTGTPLYMPPEAAQAPETLDVRGDVYQLGLLAFHLLVGRDLFEGETPVDVILQHVGTAATPPSVALGKPVSHDLDQIILRCLSKKPEDRYADAGELYDAFEECSYAGTWGQREAREWWAQWREQHPEAEEGAETASTLPSGYGIELQDRLDPEQRVE